MANNEAVANQNTMNQYYAAEQNAYNAFNIKSTQKYFTDAQFSLQNSQLAQQLGLINTQYAQSLAATNTLYETKLAEFAPQQQELSDQNQLNLIQQAQQIGQTEANFGARGVGYSSSIIDSLNAQNRLTNDATQAKVSLLNLQQQQTGEEQSQAILTLNQANQSQNESINQKIAMIQLQQQQNLAMPIYMDMIAQPIMSSSSSGGLGGNYGLSYGTLGAQNELAKVGDAMSAGYGGLGF